MSISGLPHLVKSKPVSFLKRPISRACLTLLFIGASVPVYAAPFIPASVPKTTNNPSAPANESAGNFAEFQKTVQPFLAAHCYECHDDKDAEGDTRLDILTDESSLAKGMPTLEKAIKMLTARKMPPKDEPRPSEDDYRTIIGWLNAYTTNFYMTGPIDPGRVTLHRLNRAEYNNTIRDLLGVSDFHPADAFPLDDAGYGFDNNGDVLSIAPMLMEKYLNAGNLTAQKVIFADPVVPAPLQRWDALTADGDFPKPTPAPAATPASPNSGAKALTNAVSTAGPEKQPAPGTARNVVGGAFGRNTPEGRVFQHYGNLFEDYNFPADGEYIFSFRGYGVRGDNGQPIVDFFLDSQQVGKDISVNEARADAKLYSTDPVHVTAGKHRIFLSFRNGASLEEYNAALAATPPPPAAPAVADAPAADPDAADPTAVNPADVDPTTVSAAAPAAAAGSAPAGRRGGARGARGAPGARGAAGGGPRGGGGPNSITGSSIIGVVYFEVEGPEAITPDRMPESYRHLMIAQPSATTTKSQAAEKIIRNFAFHAYRRPVTDDEVSRLLALWTKADSDGRSFDDSINVVVQAVLASPKFLFRIEQEPQPGEANNIHTLDEFELASRFSYFLWSSMPDDELLNLAEKGQLHANLDAQVTRMLKDPKAQALVENFAGQWLQLRPLENANPDTTKFPAFDASLREDMLKETQMFFTSIVNDDRSVTDFINGNYTFVNERLAKFYGIPGITGDEFQRVTFPKDSVRGGLLSQASILTVTSYPNRTSPVLRGKWVLENLLNDAPPPPPPNVPALKEDDKSALNTTLKQRMEEHRANPSCAVCHVRMDAIGFSLENFDAIGEWRTQDVNKQAIDASGSLPDGTTISGALGLKQILMAQKDKFLRCLADRMLTYALGRGTEPSDHRTLDAIVADMQKNDDKFSVLIQSIVHSDAFQKQRGKANGDKT